MVSVAGWGGLSEEMFFVTIEVLLDDRINTIDMAAAGGAAGMPKKSEPFRLFLFGGLRKVFNKNARVASGRKEVFSKNGKKMPKRSKKRRKMRALQPFYFL